jgi:hypothetical protein
MRFYKIFLLALFLLIPFCATAQLSGPVRTVAQQQNAWLGYFNQTRLSNRWGLWLDLNSRRFGPDYVNRWTLNMVRVGATYYLADNVRLTAGYSYISSYLYPSGIVRPEHRPWQQIWWSNRTSRFNTTHWIRAEQRFNRRIQGDQLADGYGFTWRFRYMLLVQVPLWGGPAVRPGVLNAVVQDEAFINASKQIVYNTFDQNRFFAGLSYPINKHLLVQAGYMNQFVQQPGGAYVSNNTLRLFLFHTLDLRKE